MISDLWRAIQSVMEIRLFDVGGTTISVLSIVIFVLAMVGTLLVSAIIRRGIRRAFSSADGLQRGSLENGLRLLHYVFILIGVAIGLDAIGIQLRAFFAAGAVVAVGVGFALQNVAQNFVSGIILLTERSIKVGDVLEVEGRVVKVVEMGIRSTTARTREEADILIPNAVLVGSSVMNYTHENSTYRLRMEVGVAYNTDIPQAIGVLGEALNTLDWTLMVHEPTIQLKSFGDSAIILDVSVWINDPWGSRFHRSELGLLIWRTFKENNITIAFPQMDVHIDGGVVLPNVGKSVGR